VTQPRARRAQDVVRKLRQASDHAEALERALGEGNWDGAWEEAVRLRSTTRAAGHLVDRFERDERRHAAAERSASRREAGK
jgi:hypothetical protein